MDAFTVFAAIWCALVTWRVAVLLRRVLRQRTVEKLVADKYSELMAGPPESLRDWWQYLNNTCSPGNLCLECEREVLRHGEP